MNMTKTKLPFTRRQTTRETIHGNAFMLRP